MYTTSLLDFHANWRSRADELSDTLEISMFMGQYYLKHHRGHCYAKVQNLARQLREEYDRMFGACDLLLMPTLPMKATPCRRPARRSRCTASGRSRRRRTPRRST